MLTTSASVLFTLLTFMSRQRASAAIHSYDQINPISSAGVPIYYRFQPLLKPMDGLCKAYAAVNSVGDISDGVQRPPHEPSESYPCNDPRNQGQVYARGGSFRGYDAIAYTWFFPKEFPDSPYVVRNTWGSRWQTVVIWLNKESDQKAYAIRYTLQDSWVTSFDFRKSFQFPHLVIGRTYNGLTTALVYNGDSQPLISWEKLPKAAAAALTSYRWGPDRNQRFPLSDTSFQETLQRSYVAPP